MSFRLARLSLLALPVAAVVVLAAGCGGNSSASPPVASTASGTTTPSTTTPRDSTPSTSPDAPGGGGSGHFSVAMKVAPGVDGRKFSACMRTHGVPSFPDPNGQGVIQLSGGPGSAVDPGSAKFQSAQQTCRKLLPDGGHATPAQAAAAKRQLLAFSACMRKHGVPNFPDPTFSGGHFSFQVGGNQAGGFNSPKFFAARQACRADLPGKGGGVFTQNAGTK
jgi:hypothetical protein